MRNDWDLPVDGNAGLRDRAHIGITLDPCRQRGAKGAVVFRIDISGDIECVGPHLQQVEQGGSCALTRHGGELPQMPRPAGGDAVGKFRQAILAHQVAILDLEVARRKAIRLQQEIDPARCSVFHLGTNIVIFRKGLQRTGAQSLANESIGARCVDPDQLRLATARCRLHELPAVSQLSRRIAGFREQDAGAGGIEAEHGPGIGAMGGDNAAIRKLDIGQEAFVTLDQASLDQGFGKEHVMIIPQKWSWHVIAISSRHVIGCGRIHLKDRADVNFTIPLRAIQL